MKRTGPGRPAGTLAAMQDSNFLLSALQPEAGVCSLALPSDLQLDRRGAEGPEAERLRAARVQEQVRARLLQMGQQPRHNGAVEPEGATEAPRGRPWRTRWATGRRWRPPRGWQRAEVASVGVAVRGQRPRGWGSGLDSRRPALSHGPAPTGRSSHRWGSSRDPGPQGCSLAGPPASGACSLPCRGTGEQARQQARPKCWHTRNTLARAWSPGRRLRSSRQRPVSPHPWE